VNLTTISLNTFQINVRYRGPTKRLKIGHISTENPARVHFDRYSYNKDENKYRTRDVLLRIFIGDVTGITSQKIRSFVRRSRYRFYFWRKDCV